MPQQNTAAPSTRPNTAYVAEIQRIAEEQSAAAGTLEAKPQRSTFSTDPRDLDAPYPDLPGTADTRFLVGIVSILALCFMAAGYFLISGLPGTRTARTTIDVPAADCPLPTPGKVLTITVLPTADATVFKTGCRTIAGRSV